MEWLILMLLVPAIIVPIVLLCGFAGCSSFTAGASPDTTVAAPSNLTAVAMGTDGIKLEWQDNSGGTAKFDVKRTTTGETLQDKSSGFVDGGRNDGTDYFYQVKAVKAGVESVPSNEAKATTKPNAPTNLVATPEDVNQIGLTWKHVTKSNKDPKKLKFKIKHTPKTPPGGITEISTSATTLDSITYTYPHPVAEGSENEYQVTAVVNGFENSISKDIESDPSVPPVTAKPLAFKADLTTKQFQTILPGNYCFVQRIAAADLHASGPQVRIIVSGAPAGNVTINSIYISKVADPGNPADYQSAADIKPVITSALPSLDANPKPLAVTYKLDKGSDLIIAFDFTASAGNDKIRFVTAPPVALHFKAGVQQAAGPRDPLYNTQPDPRLYLIEKIEVL